MRGHRLPPQSLRHRDLPVMIVVVLIIVAIDELIGNGGRPVMGRQAVERIARAVGMGLYKRLMVRNATMGIHDQGMVALPSAALNHHDAGMDGRKERRSATMERGTAILPPMPAAPLARIQGAAMELWIEVMGNSVREKGDSQGAFPAPVSEDPHPHPLVIVTTLPILRHVPHGRFLRATLITGPVLLRQHRGQR